MALLIPNDKPLYTQIEIAENALAEAFALDLITMEELEKRLSLVQASQSNSEITGYLKDLPENLATLGSEDADNKDIIDPDTGLSQNRELTVLSSNTLCGSRLKHKKIHTKVILGEQTLDYSRTILKPGKYYINLTAVLCETRIIIPPEYTVTSKLSNILSEVKSRTTHTPAVNAPEIILTGKAILSSVTIKEKSSGFIEKVKRLFFD